jgi:hypothetical protein
MLACISIILTPMSVLTRGLILVCLIILSAYYIARDGLLILPSSIKCIDWRPSDNTLIVINQLDEKYEASILAHTIVMSFGAVLNLKLKGVRINRSIIIFPDSVDHDQFRTWKVYLIWKFPEMQSKRISQK